jgi:predicted anti-sigma-YlaC factor YlaD
MRRSGRHSLVHGIAELELSCQQFVELVTDYLEGALTARTLTEVEEHLVICESCGTYLDQIEHTVAALRALGASSVPEPPSRLLAALRANAGDAR